MSEPGPSGSKKRRINEANEPSESESLDYVIRSARFWFDDGTVVLEAEKRQFRVHRGVLSTNSNVFKNMFQFPQPESEPTIEGCAVVPVHDRAQDWEDLLTMIYHPMTTQDSIKEKQFSYIASLLRLGEKYEFIVIRDYALKFFKSTLPNDKTPSWPLIDLEKVQDSVDALNIAVELRLQTVLPTLYYACSTKIPIANILDGWPREDGTVASLCAEAQRIVIICQEPLRLALMNVAWGWIVQQSVIPCQSCSNPKACAGYVHAIRKALAKSATPVLSRQTTRVDIHCKDFCPFCQTVVRARHAVSQAQFCETLPSVFQLPKWSDLKDFVH